MTIEMLIRMKPFLNLTTLAVESGIKKQTLHSKIRRRTQLSTREAVAIRDALLSAGIAYGDRVLRRKKSELNAKEWEQVEV